MRDLFELGPQRAMKQVEDQLLMLILSEGGYRVIKRLR
jgi:hypothetical protein